VAQAFQPEIVDPLLVSSLASGGINIITRVVFMIGLSVPGSGENPMQIPVIDSANG
jgi:hypothetical protein